jgi:hypothetical protein
LTDPSPTIARRCRGAHEHQGRPTTVARGSRKGYGQPALTRPRPLLDGEPRRTPGLEVKPSNISLTPQSTRLDLPPVPPRERPTSANQPAIKRRTHLTSATPYQSFRLYALDSDPDLRPGAGKGELERALDGHSLAEAELIDTYER